MCKFYQIRADNLICILCGLFMFSLPLAAQEAVFLAGTSQSDITPPSPYPHYRGLSTGVHDHLYAKALVLGQGEERVALVVCDLLWIERSLSSSARLIISEKTGIPYSNIIISGTHTHTGPAYHPNILELTGMLRPPFDEDKSVSGIDPYRDSLAIKIAESAIFASNSMEKVHLETGSTQAKGISFNRRFIMKDGKVVFNPGVGNKEAIMPAGPVDPQVGMMMLRKLSDHSPLALLSNFGLHADTFGGSSFSADYPGYLAQALSASIGDKAISIFATGPCGYINHVDIHAKDKKRLTSKEIGDGLSEVILKKIPSLKPAESSFLSMRSEYVYAPLQEYNAFELAWAIKEASPFKTTLIIELTNSHIAYVPIRKAFSQGSYETINSRLAPGGGELMVKAAINLLKEIKKEDN